MTEGNVIYNAAEKTKHSCAIPEAPPLGSLGQCPECKRVHVVGWVDYGGIALTPGWKKLRWWHIPSQMRLHRIRQKRKQ